MKNDKQFNVIWVIILISTIDIDLSIYCELFNDQLIAQGYTWVKIILVQVEL